MAKKKTAKNRQISQMTFRERFEQNAQKSIARGSKEAQKFEKKSRCEFYIAFALIAFFYAVVLFGNNQQPWHEKAVFLAILTIFILFLVFFWKLLRTYKEVKILRGKQLLKWPVRTRAGHEHRVRLLPKYLEVVSGFPILICFLVFFSLMLGFIAFACLREMAIGLFHEQMEWWQLIPFLIPAIFMVSGVIVFWRGYFWLRNHTATERKLAHKPAKTTLEVNEHPLEIGREYEFWIEQKGRYQNCHLEFYMVMIKTKCRQIQGHKGSTVMENRRECANYIVEVMEDNADIHPDSPLRHQFTLSLEPKNYVASVWYKYSLSDQDKFDWVLRVILISGNKVLIEREFPLVLVE